MLGMTKIRFYTDVPDPMQLMTQLVAQALDKQRRVTLYLADEAAAQAMSKQLWHASADTFLANAMADEPLVAMTPIHLAWQPTHIVQDELLFNYQTSQPLFFGRFRHLFEIVGSDAQEKQAGRQRYAFYRDRGYEIQHIKHS